MACNCAVFYMYRQTEFKTSLVKFKWDSSKCRMTAPSRPIVFLMSDCWFKWKSFTLNVIQNTTIDTRKKRPLNHFLSWLSLLHCFFDTKFEYRGFSCLHHSNHFYRFLTNWSDLPISTVHLRYLYICIST